MLLLSILSQFWRRLLNSLAYSNTAYVWNQRERQIQNSRVALNLRSHWSWRIWRSALGHLRTRVLPDVVWQLFGVRPLPNPTEQLWQFFKVNECIWQQKHQNRWEVVKTKSDRNVCELELAVLHEAESQMGEDRGERKRQTERERETHTHISSNRSTLYLTAVESYSTFHVHRFSGTQTPLGWLHFQRCNLKEWVGFSQSVQGMVPTTGAWSPSFLKTNQDLED